MPPPPSYIDITSLPFSPTVTQAEFNGGTYGGVANECWLRYVAADDLIFGGNANSGGNFRARQTIFLSDGTTAFTGASGSKGWWAYLSPGTYYIRVRRYPTVGPTDFDFTLWYDEGPIITEPPPVGSIVINDDQGITLSTAPHTGEYFPATVWSPSGDLIGFKPGITWGEVGDSLPNGVMLLARRNTSPWLQLVDASLNQIALFNTSPVLSAPVICNDGTYFYVAGESSDGTVHRVTDAGVSTQIATLTHPESGPAGAIGVSRDGTVLYWIATGGWKGAIHRHNLVTDTPMADFYTVPGFVESTDVLAQTGLNEHPGEIITLPDGTVVTQWQRWSGSWASILLHIAADGTLINAFEFDNSSNDETAIFIDHIHYAGSNVNGSVNLWLFTYWASKGIIGQFNLSTGVFDESFEAPLHSAGTAIDEGHVPAWLSPFGPSTSCFMVTSRYTAAGTPVTGRVPMLLVS